MQRRRNTLSEVLRLSVETVFAIVLLVVVILLIGAGRSGSETLSLLGLYAYAGFRLVPSANRMSLNLNHVRNGRPFVVDLWDDLQEIQHRDEVSCRELPRTPVEFNQAIRRGAHIALAARSQEDLSQVAKFLGKFDEQTMTVAVDLAQPEQRTPPTCVNCSREIWCN